MSWNTLRIQFRFVFYNIHLTWITIKYREENINQLVSVLLLTEQASKCWAMKIQITLKPSGGKTTRARSSVWYMKELEWWQLDNSAGV